MINELKESNLDVKYTDEVLVGELKLYNLTLRGLLDERINDNKSRILVNSALLLSAVVNVILFIVVGS